MEEMRLRHYELAAAGNMNQAIQEAQAMWQESINQMDSALNDLNGAVKYIIDGANEHPNRIDLTSGAADSGAAQPSPFGQPSAAPAAGGFGTANAPATEWGKPSGFGQSAAFGQPSTLGQQGAAFGQPSTVGQPSAFGQPSAMGQPSGFGQPSALGQGSAFGQPSTLGAGQSAFGRPAFGQTGFAQAGTTQSAFGKPAFGQPAAPATGAFGAPSAASPFTQVAQNQPATVFGAPSGPSPFRQPAAQQQPAAAGGFGQPAAPFGQPSQTASPFSQVPPPQQQQQQQPAPAAPFGQPSTAANPFGTPSALQQPGPSPFGQPAAPQGVPVETVNAGPRAFIKIDDPNELNPLPSLQGETRRDPNTKRITMWKGRPVNYINEAPCYLHPQDNKTYVRINFPDGPPDDATLRDSQGKPEEYTPEVEEAYKFFLENGCFKDGVIPSVAPRKDFISFDF